MLFTRKGGEKAGSLSITIESIKFEKAYSSLLDTKAKLEISFGGAKHKLALHLRPKSTLLALEKIFYYDYQGEDRLQIEILKKIPLVDITTSIASVPLIISAKEYETGKKLSIPFYNSVGVCEATASCRIILQSDKKVHLDELRQTTSSEDPFQKTHSYSTHFALKSTRKGSAKKKEAISKTYRREESSENLRKSLPSSAVNKTEKLTDRVLRGLESEKYLYDLQEEQLNKLEESNKTLRENLKQQEIVYQERLASKLG